MALGTQQGAAIQVRDLSLTYRGVGGALVEALRSVSIDVADGQFVSLIGPSGCGKTTLLKVLGDLLTPSEGSATIGGAPPSELRRNQQIGNMFQDSVMLPWKNIRENIRFLSKLAGRQADDAQVQDLADLVGIGGFLDKYPHELSGGMRQRAALARAYALRPKLLLMDEPFGALDEITRQRMNEELQDIWTRERSTAVFVTHSISEAVFLSDRIYIMAPRPGRIIADLEVGLPRPRLPELRFTPEFAAIVADAHARLEAAMVGDTGEDH